MMRTVIFLTVAFLGAAADRLPVQSYNVVRAGYTAPLPVEDTYEVAAAKRAFQRQYQKLAREAANAPDTHQYTQHRARTTYSYTPAEAPVQVQDTYEVAAAKQAFQRQYQKLAREAANAPDTHQYTQQQARTTYSYTPAEAPVQVQDTYEVAAAKRAFQRQYQKLAREAANAPDTHQYTQQQARTTYSYTPAEAPVQVQDTYEVAAAKQAFQRQYQKLAREAANAPDTHQYTQQQARTTYSYTPAEAPVQVQDTYEVAAAKQAFQRQYQKLAREAANAPDTHQYTQQRARTTYRYTPAEAPVQVQDTYEVAAAKRAFQREFNRRAAMAAVASY